MASNHLLAVLLQTLFLSLARAQAGTATGIVNPTTAASTATILPSASGYAYVGCYNETIHSPGSNGSRALDGGKDIASNVMTIELCLSQCLNGQGGAPIQFAGLEYGRECWCAQYLNKYSSNINETANCNYACNGNGSQICGGPDTLTLYNFTAVAKTGTAGDIATSYRPWAVLLLSIATVTALM